jgi:hypothetical protein
LLLDAVLETVRGIVVDVGKAIAAAPVGRYAAHALFPHECPAGSARQRGPGIFFASRRRPRSYWPHLVSKRRSGRSPDWLKMKNANAPAVKREEEEEWAKRNGDKLSHPFCLPHRCVGC